MNKSKVIGIAIFIIIILIGGYLYFGPKTQVTEITGYVGGEKIPLLKDEQVIKILKNEYGIEIDYVKAGSIEMAREDVSHMDFIFPSSQIAYEIFKDENATHIKNSDIILNSPIVLYSWKEVADALVSQGIATQRDGIYYDVDMQKLVSLIASQKGWSDIGLDLYGNIKVICTDPLKSNSGNMYLGLLANSLCGDVATLEDLDTHMPTIKRIFDDLGFMESSSGTLFDRYIVRGIGDSPIIAGYESQMIDFAINNPDKWEVINDSVAIIYPTPTVWSEHPFIALTDAGKTTMDALFDEELQRIATNEYGFRTLYPSDIQKIPQGIVYYDIIDQTMPMPKSQVMEKLMEGLDE